MAERDEHDGLDEVYDEWTLARVDAWARPPGAPRATPAAGTSPRRSLGQRGAAGALVTALALGIQEALEPERRDPVVEEIDLAALVDRDEPVSVYFVPGEPARSIAFIRPWRFRAAS